MLILAVHEEDAHKGLNLLMVNDRIQATAKPLDFGVINEWAILIGIAHF